MKIWLTVGVALLAVVAIAAVAVALLRIEDEVDQRNCLTQADMEFPIGFSEPSETSLSEEGTFTYDRGWENRLAALDEC